MIYYAGIDGGQSSSVCVLGDARGNVIARVHGERADLVDEPLDSARQANTIDALLAGARARAGLGPDTPIEATVAGISGADADAPPAQPPRTPDVHIVHDSEIAHAGAFSGGPGILVIAGTGSVALGIDARGRRARAGGWGYYFGDEGSAGWIGRTAVRFAMEAHDRGHTGVIEGRLLQELGVDSLGAVQHGFARGTIDRVRLARLAVPVFDLAWREDDPAARLIAEAATRALAELVAIVSDRLDCQTVSYAGSLFKSEHFVRSFGEQVRALRSRLTIAPPIAPPEIGALLLARRGAEAVGAS